MSLTVGDKAYSSEDVAAAIHAGNEAYYNFDVDELTQTEMDAVLAYAKEKGMGVIPMLNTPGHMDAILAAATSLTGTNCSYNGSVRTIDVTNNMAVTFTQELLKKYVAYFAGKGCKYFNMGADEYANDKYTGGSMGFGNLQSTGNYSYYVKYVNAVAALIKNAGMTPMKPWFKGEQVPPRKRVCTCQKCIRTGDIENVGHTARHGTYFEMLGNFSFGDYFKHEAIAWSWEFLTSEQWVGLDPNRLYPSVYVDDDEAWNIWHDEIGIPAEKIFRFGKEDNFWEHGAGPCGPCSEIYYDRGAEYGCGKPDCTVGCDCDRYIEVWNNVFSQFDNDGHGNYTELSQKNIDTGMGLERLAVVCQGVNSLFDVDTVMNITHKVSEITGAHYGESNKRDVSLRVITDHIRSATFMICDGILPSNEGRGYVLRRLLRRAARHGKLLGCLLYTSPSPRDTR